MNIITCICGYTATSVNKLMAHTGSDECCVALANENAHLRNTVRQLISALKAHTDWKEKIGERAAILAQRLASNDYDVLALESLANEVATLKEELNEARIELSKRLNQNLG